MELKAWKAAVCFRDDKSCVDAVGSCLDLKGHGESNEEEVRKARGRREGSHYGDERERGV